MKNTRLLFVIWMLFLVYLRRYSQEKEDSSVLGASERLLSKHELTAWSVSVIAITRTGKTWM